MRQYTPPKLREIVDPAEISRLDEHFGVTRIDFMLRHKTKGEHVHVDLFAGPFGRTRANCGHVVMTPDEWRAFCELLRTGSRKSTYQRVLFEPEEH